MFTLGAIASPVVFLGLYACKVVAVSFITMLTFKKPVSSPLSPLDVEKSPEKVSF